LVLAPTPRPAPGDFIFLTTTFSMSGVLAGTVFEAQPLAPHRGTTKKSADIVF
jgi:hypothetical protein